MQRLEVWNLVEKTSIKNLCTLTLNEDGSVFAEFELCKGKEIKEALEPVGLTLTIVDTKGICLGEILKEGSYEATTGTE